MLSAEPAILFLLSSSEAKKNKPDLSTSAAAVSEASQLSPAAVPQPVTGTPTSVPGGATPTMGVTDAAQAYQGQQQAYQSPQQQQEAWAAYNQYQQQQQAWAAYYSQYGQQVSGRGRRRGCGSSCFSQSIEGCCVAVQVEILTIYGCS